MLSFHSILWFLSPESILVDTECQMVGGKEERKCRGEDEFHLRGGLGKTPMEGNLWTKT